MKNQAKNIFLSSTILGVAMGSTTAQAVDISCTYSFMNSTFARDVAINGPVAYLADQDEGLLIFDITDPVTPVFLGSWDLVTVAPDLPGRVWAMTAVGSTVYLSDFYNGLQIIDASDPTNPTLVGSLALANGGTYNTQVVGNTAYVADGFNGLRIVDITNPATPTILGSYNTLGTTHDVYVDGNIAYVADWTKGLQVFDVSNPASPTLIGSYSTPPIGVSDIELVGTTIVSASYSGFQTFDVSDPTSPTLLSTTDLITADPVRVLVGDDMNVYVSSFAAGVVVFDITNPSSPQIIETFNVGSTSMSVAIDGNIAYIAEQSPGGLRIIDRTGVCGDTCPADLNDDGITDISDVFLFLTAYSTQSPDADFTAPFGVVDINDVFAFLNAYNAGCI